MAEEKILAKITKLLALATSDNQNEAEIAASKAQEMLFQYNISEEELAGFSNVKSEKVVEVRTSGKAGYNRVAWYGTLASIVAKANLCDLLTSGAGLIWIGKPTNIEVAQYIFENLARDLERIADNTWYWFNLAQRNSKQSWEWVHGKTWKNNFYHGANQSIRARLNANLRQLEEAQPEIGSLIINNDVELEEFMKIHYPRLSYTANKISHNRAGFDAGKAAGTSVQFRSGMGAGGANSTKLLKG